MKLSSKVIESKLMNKLNGNQMYGLVINEDECMVMVLEGDHGIVSYGMNIYGNELSLEGMEMNAWNWKLWYECMVLQLRFWMNEWYCN